ncbi:MAG: hypothetical protein LIO90_06915 [Bacteroidales bacterium]|nr:hypothetical protein [Bacteroidales bacterium]
MDTIPAIDNLSRTASVAVNRFSWRRVVAVSRLHWGAMGVQMLAYFGVATVCTILFFIPYIGILTKAIALLLFYALELALVFSPLVFTYKSGLEMETMLPARGSEKAVMTVGYIFIVLPFVTFLPIATGITAAKVGMVHFNSNFFATIFDTMLGSYGRTFSLSSILSFLALMATCLFAVVSTKKARALKSFLWTAGVYIGISIITGIATVIIFFFKLKDLTTTNIELINANTPGEVIELLGLSDILYFYNGLLGAATIVLIILTVRSICRRQL